MQFRLDIINNYDFIIFNILTIMHILYIFYFFIMILLNEKKCNIFIYIFNTIEFDCAIEKKK